MKLVDDDGKDVEQGEVGEIAIRGENVMKGYWGREEDTAEAIQDGWFRTGDMAKQDEDGYFFIVDRKKDLIIRGGYNVYPREVEEALYEHEAVAEVAVIGIPHDDLGEEVGAAVALKAGQRRSTRRSCRRSRRSGSRPTSTPAPSGSSTSCPRARPARSCAARSSAPDEQESRHERRHARPRPRTTRGRRRAHEDTDGWPAPLDLLLADATRSPLRRFLPGMSGVRFTAGLARRPRAGRRRARRAGRRAGQGRRRPLRARAAREGPPLRRGGLGQEPAAPAHAAGLPRARRGRPRAGRRRRARLGRRPADELHRRQPRRGRPPRATTRSSTPRCSSGSIDTGGGNLVEGGRRFVRDFATAAAGALDGRARRVRGRQRHRGDARVRWCCAPTSSS